MRIGRLELEKTLCLHARAEGIDDLPAQHDVLMQLFTAQIEKTIAQPHLFWIILLAEHGDGQFGGGPQNLDCGHIDFDEAGRHFGIFSPRGAMANLSVDPDHPFRTKLLGLRESRRIRIHDTLGYAIVIAKIDEQDAAMIADTMAPAGETNRFAGVGFTQVAAAMGTVAVHIKVTSKRKGKGAALRFAPSGRRTAWAAPSVKTEQAGGPEPGAPALTIPAPPR